jgi:hypothetical protein
VKFWTFEYVLGVLNAFTLKVVVSDRHDDMNTTVSKSSVTASLHPLILIHCPSRYSFRKVEFSSAGGTLLVTQRGGDVDQ